MKKEIAIVIFFLKCYLKRSTQNSAKIDLFVERLAVALQDKFKGHWYPDDPSKGQAYRCIRINSLHREDPELQRACQESGIEYQELKLPQELTLWVDPGEVCCRYKEDAPYFSVAMLSKDEDEKEVAKNVAKALERVTSDYHSGSSSDEETAHNTLARVNHYCNTKVNDFPHWHSNKMAKGSAHIFPKPHHMSRPGLKPVPHHIMKQHLWAAAQRRRIGYWGAHQHFHQYY
ncbi:unnamed protein product [Knipowitschia caucasica]